MHRCRILRLSPKPWILPGWTNVRSTCISAGFPSWGPLDFLSWVPPGWGYRRSRRRRFLRVFFLAGKFSRFDAAVTLAGDVDSQGRVLQPVADGIGDHRIGNDLRPVIERQLRREDGRFADRTLL